MEIITNLHQIPQVTGNCFLLIDPDGLTLIDAGLPRDAPKVLAYIRASGRPLDALKQILITHADIDHMGGAAAIQKATGAKIWASQIEAEAMATGDMSRPIHPEGWRKLFFGVLSRLVRPDPVETDRILTDGEMLPIMGGLQVVPTPGHTPGHLSFWASGAGVLFAGDSLRSEDGRPVTSHGWNNWDVRLAQESTQAQAALKPSWLCPGHGQVLENPRFPSDEG